MNIQQILASGDDGLPGCRDHSVKPGDHRGDPPRPDPPRVSGGLPGAPLQRQQARPSRVRGAVHGGGCLRGPWAAVIVQCFPYRRSTVGKQTNNTFRDYSLYSLASDRISVSRLLESRVSRGSRQASLRQVPIFRDSGLYIFLYFTLVYIMTDLLRFQSFYLAGSWAFLSRLLHLDGSIGWPLTSCVLRVCCVESKTKCLWCAQHYFK